MALKFPDHPDVVFRDAPLAQVLCQIRFDPILALLHVDGVIGLQEALRREYPKYSTDHQAEIAMTADSTVIGQRAPVYRMRDSSETWQVSAAVDFVALETSAYRNFEEFSVRLMRVVSAVERTLSPDRSTRIGFRKVNLLHHPLVEGPSMWGDFIRAEQLGIFGSRELPSPEWGFAELHLAGDDCDVLSIRHGVPQENSTVYVIDLDYWTTKSYVIEDSVTLRTLLHNFSESITGYFHWCLTDTMKEYLRPRPRLEVG